MYLFENAFKDLRDANIITEDLDTRFTEDQLKYFKNTVIKDAQGYPEVCYHSTPYDFSYFNRGDIGYHFASEGIAKAHAEAYEDQFFQAWEDEGDLDDFETESDEMIFDELVAKRMKICYLNIQRPAHFDIDPGNWNDGPVVAGLILCSKVPFTKIEAQLNAKGMKNTEYFLRKLKSTFDASPLKQNAQSCVDIPLTSVDIEKLLDTILNNSPITAVRDFIKSKGYDGIIYVNSWDEAAGDSSYIIFDSNQAKYITNLHPTSAKELDK